MWRWTPTTITAILRAARNDDGQGQYANQCKRTRGARAAAERPHCRTGRATVFLSVLKTQRVSVALPRRQIFLRLPKNTALLKESFARLQTDEGPPSSTDLARCGSRELLEGSAAILKAVAVQRSGKDQRQRISLAIFCELACSGVPDGAKNATLASDLPYGAIANLIVDCVCQPAGLVTILVSFSTIK